MIFRFVVRHLHWLSKIPGLPQLFDSMFLAWTVLSNRPLTRTMEKLEKSALQIPGVTLAVHRLGGMEFMLAGRELGHLHGNGLLDVRVGRDQARELIVAGRAIPHHVFGDSAWVSFWLRREDDVAPALELLCRSIASESG